MAISGSIFNAFMLFTLTKLSLCLYEDQIGKFDWRQSYVGRIKFASFDSVKRIIVATEENVVAALNIKSGQVIWRQVLESPFTNSIHLLHVDKEVATVSGDGNTFLIRGWDLNTGILLWDWNLYMEKTNAHWVISNAQLIHVVPVAGSHLEITEYELQNGRNRGATSKISTPWLVSLSKCVLAKVYWTCLYGEGAKAYLYYLDVSATNSEISTVYTKVLTSLLGDVTSEPHIKRFDYVEPAVLVEIDSVLKLVVLQENFPYVIPRVLTPNTITMNGDQVFFMSLELIGSESLRMRTFEAEGEETTTDSGYPLTLGAPKALSGVCRGSACRVLFITSDDALCLLQVPTGKILWTREEALSNIVGVEFIELPVSDLDASIEREFTSTSTDVFSMLYRRLLSQARQLSSILAGKQAASSGLVRDEFGLHKLIIIATKSGKLLALDTLKGDVVWSRLLPQIEPFLVLDKPVMLLLEQRNARYPPLLPQCILLARDSQTGLGVMFRFDPITGSSELGAERLPFRIKQAMLSPHEDDNHLKAVAILADDNKIHVYPSSAGDIIARQKDSIFLYSINANTSVVQGYKFAEVGEGELGAGVTWQVNLGPSKIVAASVRPGNERVHSQGRVLADRSVLYKYINPNLVALATLSEDPLHKHVLSVYLIDGVTGLVVYSINHKRCKGPVHLVHSENWVVYSYFSERFRRIELTAVELYEGATQSNSTAFSSHAVSQLPHVETLAYILPATPLVMASTLTERGITSKQLLVALSNGAVTELPWMFLEPRGPHIFSGPDEGSIPYMPELPLMSETTINYNQSLFRVTGIHVSPARLESTTLVLVQGLDLFFTRVTPSKTFDVLKEDFDHWLIIMVLVGLVASTYIIKQLASKKALRQAWK